MIKLRIGGHYLRAQWAFAHLRGERLEAYQARRARAMVRYAVVHAPFYRQHWQRQDLNDWQHLPTVDKSLMMANFDTFNTVGVCREDALNVALRAEQSRDFTPTLNGYTVGLSSGTSGHRGLFVVSSVEQAAWAGTLPARVLPGLRRQGWRVALLLRSNSNLYERAASRLVTFRYLDLMLPVAEAAQQMAAFQPDILVAPPSALLRLAEYRDAMPGKAAASIHPRKIIAVAEVLELEERKRLEHLLCSDVGEIYQATEGLLGVTCPQGALHVQEDVVAIQTEGIDATQPEYVTPIVTDLWRMAQPMVRYRLGDIWQMDEKPCPCGSGFRVIRRVLGRLEDVFQFPDANDATRSRLVFPDQIHRLAHGHANPKQRSFAQSGTDGADTELPPAVQMDYRAIQEHRGHLRLHINVPAECFTDITARLRASIPTRLLEQGCRCEQLEIVRDWPPEPPNVKRQRVRNLTGM